MEIDFYSTEDNPPAIHTLAKNYLDLLEAPISGTKTRRKNLLYKDDKLIKLLIVNYHPGLSKSEPSICIKIDNLKNFILDLELVDRIKQNNFEKDENSFYDHHQFPSGDIEEERDFDYHEPVSDLKELEREKEWYIAKFGEQFYNLQKDFYQRAMQEEFLKINNFSIKKTLSLLGPYMNHEKDKLYNEWFKDLAASKRYLTLLSSALVEFGNAPIKKGDKKKFKENVKKQLDEFKNKYRILFPLKHPISTTLLFLPPKRQIDLDNLARYVIPFVNEIIQPPPKIKLTYDQENLPEHLKKHVEKSAKIPKNSITKYQIIILPRLESDPIEGYVHLIIGDGLDFRSMWKKIDNFIDNWEKSIR